MKFSGAFNYFLSVVLTFYPAWRILKRAGFNPAWAFSVVVPVLGSLVLILLLAFAEWPKLERKN